MRSLVNDPAWKAQFDRGMRDMFPAMPGLFSWALVTGMAMVKSGLPVRYALLMSLIAYAGTAQLASLPLIAAGAPVWVIAVTATITNLRFVIYGAAMRRVFAAFSLRRRAVLGYLSGDFSFAMLMEHVAEEGLFPHRDAWLLGAALPNWVVWQAGSITGIIAASFVPTSWGLQFAGPLALLALVVPQCRQRPMAAGALIAAIVSVFGYRWPLNLGLIAAVIAGISAATLVDTTVRAPQVVRS